MGKMNIVVVGHVDHGKSTLIGKLLEETNSLPEGKLEQVKQTCEKNSKPFEYAFLLDALEDEQSQGITIDTARIFFKSKKREYIIIDAPGHIEFLKNMISGAARAEAAILVIDANEGIAENSKRHGYLLSMLGIKKVVVAVNKLDLINYDENIYNNIVNNFTNFLNDIGITPDSFVPVSARNGVNISVKSDLTKWYSGNSILETIDNFKSAQKEKDEPFRMFVQDVYKFSANGNDKRIIAGTVNSGSIKSGDEIKFYPSEKTARITSIKKFNEPDKSSSKKGEAIGITIEPQLYLKPGELIFNSEIKPPALTNTFQANIIWMGKENLVLNKTYKLKIGTKKTEIIVKNILSTLNASNLQSQKDNTEVKKYEVAKCLFEAKENIAFDLVENTEDTSRFVLIDNYDIAGGGIIISADETENNLSDVESYKQFEIEMNALIRKHFPHWNLKEVV